jgi:DNA-3-methyladenine glycosylase II
MKNYINIKELQKGTEHLLRNDKHLATLIKKIGKCNLQLHKDYYLALLQSIICQQLSSKAADAIYTRFMNYFNQNPSPDKILETEHSLIRNIGLSNSKVKFIKDLSEKIIKMEINLDNINSKTDNEIISELTKVKGIGIWTVHMFLIFSVGRLNILPTGDLGLKRAIMFIYKLKKFPDEKRFLKISRENNWSPYCSIASWYLWKSLEKQL